MSTFSIKEIKDNFSEKNCRCIWCDNLSLARHGGGGYTTMGRGKNMVRSRGRKGCRWTSDNDGSNRRSALNGSFAERMDGHLAIGHPFAFVVTFYRPNLFHNGRKSSVFFFRLFFQINYLRALQTRLLSRNSSNLGMNP